MGINRNPQIHSLCGQNTRFFFIFITGGTYNGLGSVNFDPAANADSGNISSSAAIFMGSFILPSTFST